MRFDLALAASEARSVIRCLLYHKSGSGFESKPGTVVLVCTIGADWAALAGNVLIC